MPSPHGRKVTLADVAAAAGVSPTTASYILNGRADQMRISVEAQERVRRAAADLAYRPNRTARQLRGGHASATRTLAMVSDHLAGGAYASRMLDGARDEARRRGHLLVVGETDGDHEMAERVIEEMLDRQVDGILFATLVTGAVAIPATLRQEPPVPVVLLNCVDPAASRLRSVLPDDRSGGVTATELVLAAHESARGLEVAVIGDCDQSPDTAGRLRYDGLAHALSTHGLRPATLVPTVWDVVPARLAVTRWLDTVPRDRVPHAFVCLNDRVAMGTCQALREHGLRVPEDVAVVSFDGSDLAAWLEPPVTSITIPYLEMGALAVQIMLDPDSVPRPPGGVDLVPMPVRYGASLGSGGRSAGPAGPRSDLGSDLTPT